MSGDAAALLTVVALGAVELWAAVPAGLALGLDPLVTALAAGAGAMGGVAVVAAAGGRLRGRLVAGAGRGRGRRHGRILRLWQRHGVAGLGLLAPLLVGAPLGTALGIAFGAPARRLFGWMAAGVVLWSGALALAGALGIAGVEGMHAPSAIPAWHPCAWPRCAGW